MKHKKIFRMLTVALVLALMLVAIPVQSVLAIDERVSLEDDEGDAITEAAIDGRFWVNCRYFMEGVDVDIYLSSQEVEPGYSTELDDELTVYEWYTSGTPSSIGHF